jgi:ribosome-binding factor A
MDSTRQQKYSRLIQKELGNIFQNDIKNMFGKAFISVNTVRISPDLSVAKAYLSFMMVDNKQEALESVKAQVKPIRKLLGDKIRKQARIIPELIFYLDDNVDYAAKMDVLFSNIEIPPVPPDEDTASQN